MRRFALAMGLCLISLIPAQTARADSSTDTPAAGLAKAVVCAPRIQLRHGQVCGDLGPAAQMAALARQGVYPQRPLPTKSVDPALSYLPFRYVRLSNQEPTRLYTSVQDARSGVNAFREIEPGFDFISWLECEIVEDKAIYMIAPGVYMRGGGDCSQIATPDFHGLHFYRTPDWAFAWVLGGTYASLEAGNRDELGDRWLNRYQVVRVYDQTQANGQTWYRIGEDEWLEQRLLAVVEPDPLKPEGVEGDRWISVNLHQQTLAVYEAGELVFATLVSSGLPGWWTQPGAFQVYIKLEKDDMSGSFELDRSDYYFLQDVPWVLYYDQARALHGAYWHNGYGYPRSHGCLNLSPADARWLFEWAQEGTWVYVWDPSGKTPTDPDYYGAGGA